MYSKRSKRLYIPKYNDNGVSFPTGIGCSRHPNCFTCPFAVCTFGNRGYQREDYRYMASRGDGIKHGIREISD